MTYQPTSKEALAAVTPADRHKQLLDSLEPMLAAEIMNSSEAYAIISMIMSGELAQDVAHMQPVSQSVSDPSNATHPFGLIRALHSQWFPGTELERKLAASQVLFRALGRVSTPNFEAEHLLFETATAVLKDLVALETEAKQ